MTVFSELRQRLSKGREQVSELIGRISHRVRFNYLRVRPTVDYTQTDYEWYDKFRRGQQPGYEIGGLFGEPMANIIASWSLGDGFNIDGGNQRTGEAIDEFLSEHLQTLVETAEDYLSLGDAYLIVNADGSLTRLSPEQVEIERDELDMHTVLSVTVRTQNESVEIEDIYTPAQRTVRIKRGNAEIEEQTFPNLIGRIPIVHFANDRGANETNGHPYFEALLTLFAEYDDAARKGLDGVKIMGNPVPVAEGLEDPEGAKELNATYTDTYTDREGNTQTEHVTELSPNEILYFGAGARFHFAAPGPFADNTVAMLKNLFYIMLQFAKIPEWVWGGAIASSMASVQAQAPAFVKFIGGRRRKLERPIKDLLEIYLTTLGLFRPGIAIETGLKIEWPELMPIDREILLKWVMWLEQRELITAETALRLADVVKDVQAEVEAAQQEAEDAQQRFEERLGGDIEALMRQGRENGAGAESGQPQPNGAQQAA